MATPARKSAGKVIYLRPKKLGRLKKAKSYEQLRQRELAWMLYITEGYAANMAHALAVNCVTFNHSDEAAVSHIVAQVEEHAERLRALMHDLSEKE